MKRIENEVNQILNKNSIFIAPVPVKKIAKSFGLTIKTFDLGPGISGALFLDNGYAVIGVSPNDSRERKRFTIAHEIGHYYLHRAGNNLFVENQAKILFRDATSGVGVNKEEREANAFAAALLMPENFLQKEINSLDLSIYNSDDKIVAELSRRFLVSTITMTYRLSNLGYFH